LAAYQGEYGLEQFWHLKASEGKMPAGVILSIPHLMVTLDEMRDIDNEQQKYLRKFNVKPLREGMYPNVKQIIPGLLPMTPEPELLPDVARILEQTIWVIEHALKNDKAFIHTEGDGEDDYYFRIPVLKDNGSKWIGQKNTITNNFQPVSATYDSLEFDRFKNLPPFRDVLQMELCPLPFPVREDGKPDYFPSGFFVTNARSGIIEMFEAIPPFPTYHEMTGKLPDILIKQCLKKGWRPDRVKYRAFHLTTLMSFLQKHKIAKAWHAFHLPAVDEALDSMMKSIDGQG
jgi:hypothetical protein